MKNIKTAITLLLFLLISGNSTFSDVLAQSTAKDGRTKAEIEALYWARKDSAKMEFTQADVDFMSGMIGHHAQALIMSSLAKPNGASKEVQTLAARIINAQKDEINIMQQWLADRNQMVPQVTIDGLDLILTPGKSPSLTFDQEQVAMVPHERMGHMMSDHSGHDMDEDSKEKPEEMQNKMHDAMSAALNHSSHMGHMADNGQKPEEMMMHDHSGMPGMLTQTQLEELADAKGQEFDRLFLTYMIGHHAGAVIMVKELVSTDGAAQENQVGKLAGDINVDQTTEIERMKLMLLRMVGAASE